MLTKFISRTTAISRLPSLNFRLVVILPLTSMKSFLYHIKSLDRILTLGDTVTSQTIAAIWQRKQKTAIPSWLGIGMCCLFGVTIAPGQATADPASNAVNFAGAITTVPDGVCAVAATVAGGGGGASATLGGTGGSGGAGAIINARFWVLPGQAVTGAVGGGGAASSGGGSGTASGGNGGTVVVSHRGAGGGGSSSMSVAGLKLIEAGGGGGGSAAHDSSPAGVGGNAGFSGIAPSTVAPGSDGKVGVDNPSSFTVGGGQGGQATAGGAGGSNTGGSSVNGSPGGGIGSGNGGNGGPDPANDSGGGGGGGYTGGGGGASTINNTVSGGGGGGGSSYVRGTSPTALASVPTNVSGAAGTSSTGTSNGTAGAVTLDWIPCVYSLGITKKASAATVNAGNKVIWTVTVTNNGPNPMTRGDTITLSDTLPNTGISSSTPQFKVLSLTTTSGSTDSNLDSSSMTCTGVNVGQAMPASTVCSRPYSSASSPGVTASGTRGLNSGETLTITYEEIFANKTAAATITNTASTKDRSSTTGTTDIVGVTATRSASDSTTIQPYDLKVVKSVSSAKTTLGATITWTVNVTNLGLADMEGPFETAANPLIVTDVAPITNVSTPASFTSTGSAGTCTYISNTITCSKGLPIGQTQTFTFQQTVNANAPTNATIPNTATVSDYFTGDSNDSSTVSTTTVSHANVLLVKRITAINGDRTKNPNDSTALNVFVDGTSINDNNANWPTPTSGTPAISTFLRGAIDAGKVKPGDTIEYTLYFLNASAGDATGVKICDRITGEQTLLTGAYGASKDIQLHKGNGAFTNWLSAATSDLTSAADAGDRAQLMATSSVPTSCHLDLVTGGATDTGTLVVDVTGTGNISQPNWNPVSGSTAAGVANSYGFIRFTTKVNP
jgi:uncharacterized repeat protein (TIGR01451 family)